MSAGDRRAWDREDFTRVVVAMVALFLASPSLAAGERIRFWNLTTNTITTLQLAPAGTNKWGPNQCANDPDGSVDHDERLRITDVSPGRYDARFKDKKGRVCIVRNIDIKENDVFAIEERQLTDCGR